MTPREDWSVAAEAEHDESDDRIGGAKAEAAADDQPGLGVGGLDQPVAQFLDDRVQNRVVVALDLVFYPFPRRT
ncbi:hypothetical protein [Streptomyces pimonensis]|uniref:hypothetical protein n=1 Tax=Streptomyces pimonensis TaxID=2860288 RepID=UPI003F9FBE63